MSFFSKQFIDVIQWTEPEDGILAYRYPDGGHGDPEWRQAHGSRFSDGRLRQ